MSRRRTSRSMQPNVLLLPNGMEPNVLLLPNASGFGGFGSPEMRQALGSGDEVERVRKIVVNNVREMKRLLREYKRASNSISVKKQGTAAKFLANAMTHYGTIYGAYYVTVEVSSLASLRIWVADQLNNVQPEIYNAMKQKNWLEEEDVP